MQEKILLTGDSWFAGCWSKELQIVHPGVTKFLRRNYNYNVKNLARGGFTNQQAAGVLHEISIDLDKYHVFAIITDPIRQYDIMSEDGKNILGNSVAQSTKTKKQFLEKYFQALHEDLDFYNKIAQQHNITITLFSGLCDLKEEYLHKYKNLKLGLDSWQGLIVPNLERPGIARGNWQYLLSPDSKECLVELAEELHTFYADLLGNHPGFKPDSSHPSISEHEKLAWYIDNLIKSDKY